MRRTPEAKVALHELVGVSVSPTGLHVAASSILMH
jgi:hypothetical protein